MYKKIAGTGLCLLLASSVYAIDPFTPSYIAVTESSSEDEKIATTTAEIREDSKEKVEKSDTENADSSSSTEKESKQEASTTEYTVVAGDYLMSIASRLLGDSSRWPEIVELNKDKYPSLVSNPNLIYSGWTFTIPAKDGVAPVVTAKDSSTSTTNVASAGSNNTEKSSEKTSSTSSSNTTSSNSSSKSSEGAIITSSSKVLHIGDSHSCGVYGKTIDGLMRDTGATVNTVAVAGSNPSYFMNGTTTKCGYYSKDEKGNVTEPYWTTPMQTPLLKDLIEKHKPNVLVVSLGANMVGYGESTIRNMIESVCDKAKEAGCKIVWVGPPDSRTQNASQVSQLYNILNSEIAKYNGVLVDSRKYTDYPASGGDGLHYSGTEGTAKAKTWANSVMGAINGK